MKHAIIVGASSGMGREVCNILLSDGWKIGIAARRESLLEEIKASCPDRVEVMKIDVTAPDAAERLLSLAEAGLSATLSQGCYRTEMRP